jgi:hypothetical protein
MDRNFPARWLDRLQTNSRLLLKLLVIAGLCAICGFVIPRLLVSGNGYLIPAAILAASLGGILIYKWPQLSLLGLVTGGLLYPNALPLKLNFAVLFAILAILLWLLRLLTQRNQRILPGGAFTYAWVSLLAAFILAFFSGQIQWFQLGSPAPMSGQLRQMMIFLISLLILAATPSLLHNLRWLKIFTYSFLLISAGVYLWIDSLYVMRIRLSWMGDYIPTLNDIGAAGSLLWIFALAFAFSFGLFDRKMPIYVRLFLLAGVGLRVYVSLTDSFDWKSGWVPAFLALAVIIFLRYKKARLPFVAGAVLLLLIFNSRILSYLQQGDSYSVYTRLAAWQTLLNVISANPILGVGPANYSYYTTLFPILGYSVKFNSHNQFVDLVAQCGIVGLLAYLWLFIELAKLGWIKLDRFADGFERIYILSVLGGIAGSFVAGMLGDWVLPFVYNVGLDGMRASLLFWVFCGGLLLLNQERPA